MRIAVWHNLPSGGGKRALNDHLRGLTQRGHTVEVWAPPRSDEAFLSLAPYGKQHTVALEPKVPKTRIERIRAIAGRAEALAEAHRVHAAEVARQMDAGDFDVVFANTDLDFHAPFLGRFVKRPAVLYLQETNRPLYQALPEFPWLARQGKLTAKAKILDHLELQALRQMAREEVENARTYRSILVNSQFSRECLLAAYGIESDVCYLGIDAGRFRDLGLERDDRIVGIGAFVPSKRIDFVIKSLGTLPEGQRPPLEWIGNAADEPYLASLNAQAERLGVRFQPRLNVSDDIILETLNRAALMAYAPRLEPFGYAPLEANACGAPVVAVAEGGVRETIQHGVNGLLADSDPESFGRAIQSLLADPAGRTAMGHEGIRLARTLWSFDHSIDRLESRLSRATNL